MEAQKDISIIIPIYNMAKYLKGCVSSICKQDYGSFELILVDDGSTDDSLALCRRFAALDERIEVYHQENKGPGPARNLGIEHASGKYALFLDADDLLHEGALSTLIQASEDGFYDLLVFGFCSKLFEGNVISEKKYPAFTCEGETVRQSYGDYIGDGASLRIQGAPWNKLFSLDIIRKHKVEYPSLHRHEDEVFIGRYMCFAEQIRFLPEVLYTHYVSDICLQWTKYRADYISDVIGNYKDRKRNILRWNPADTRTREHVEKEYIDTALRALEMSFAPKFGFDPSQRLAWMKDTVKQANLSAFAVPSCVGRYKKLQMRLIQMGKYKQLYAVLWLKIQMEKNGWLYKIKNAAGRHGGENK